MRLAAIDRKSVFAGIAFLGSLVFSNLKITAAEGVIVWVPPPSLYETMGHVAQSPTTPITVKLEGSDGSLGEFRPTHDITIDSSNASWNGNAAVLDTDPNTGAVLGGVFKFTNVFVPQGVTVRFSGFGYVVIAAASDIVINGTIEANGGNGGNGRDGQSGRMVPGGNGGNGGNGGMATGDLPPGTTSRQGGRGLPGGGGGGVPAGIPGQPGAGQNSPGQPMQVRSGKYPRPTGGGSAGGSNGTQGARGLGTLADGFYLPAQPIGSRAIGLNPPPAGGGSGADGGFGVRVINPSDGSIVGQGTGGGGGGGGGAGGTIIIQTAENLTINGTIRANGGNGGNGGEGASNSYPAPPPGGEGGDGGGGGAGGAGGSLLLRGRAIAVNGRIEAKGGLGGLGGLPGASASGVYYGFPGGAGGGGRIAAIASQRVSGLTSNQGTDAIGRDRPGEPTVFTAVVSLTQTVSSFVPQNGNSTRYTAEIGSGTTGARFRFELKKVSAFVGDAMNHFINDDPADPANYASDYYFAPQAGFNPPSEDELTIETQSEVTSINVTVSSRDYGGIGEIHATAILNGIEVEAGVLGTTDLFARLPLDNDQNWMPDGGWDVTGPGGGRHVADPGRGTTGSDLDNIPAGAGVGDNLTNFEEYRGFFVQGQHRRLDPFKKDLFIKSEFDGSVESVLNQGIGFAANLPLTVHQLRLNSNELDEDGVVNYNFINYGEGGGIPNHVDQAGLTVLVGEDGNPVEYGSVEAPGLPNTTRVIEIYAGRLRMHSPPIIDYYVVDELDPFDDRALRYLIAHQVGHAIGMRHYTYDGGPTPSNMVTGYLLRTADLSDPRWNNIPDSFSSADIAQIRLK